MSSAWQNVHVRVNDAATGKPTPVRIRFSNAEGANFAPWGRSVEFPIEPGAIVEGNVRLHERSYAYIDGSCEIRLPTGLVHVEICKGPEYRPVRESFQLTAGKMALRFAIERDVNLRESGWHSGDCRAHFLSPHAALLEGAAEDVAVVNLLAKLTREKTPQGFHYSRIPDLIAFSGQGASLERDGHMVAVNTFNTHAELGSLALLHCHRVVYPLESGGELGDDWFLADWCHQCHRKKGLVVWADAPLEICSTELGEFTSECIAELILGQIDAVEVLRSDWRLPPGNLLYTLLEAGFATSLAASSGKHSNAQALGSPRAYARLRDGESLSYSTWIEAVRAGRTFATSGPILIFTANGRDPGAKLHLDTAAPPLRLAARAWNPSAGSQLEIVWRSTTVAQKTLLSEPGWVNLELEFPAAESGWLAARLVNGAGQVAAHTSPILVEMAGAPFMPDVRALDSLANHLEGMIRWTKEKARFQDELQRGHLLDVFQAAHLEVRKRRAASA